MHFSVCTLLAVAAAAQLAMATPEPGHHDRWEAARVIELEGIDNARVIERPPTRGGWHGGSRASRPQREAVGGEVTRVVLSRRDPARRTNIWASRVSAGHEEGLLRDETHFRNSHENDLKEIVGRPRHHGARGGGEKTIVEGDGTVQRLHPDGLLRIARRDPLKTHGGQPQWQRLRLAEEHNEDRLAPTQPIRLGLLPKQPARLSRRDPEPLKRPMRENVWHRQPSRATNGNGGIVADPSRAWNRQREPSRATNGNGGIVADPSILTVDIDRARTLRMAGRDPEPLRRIQDVRDWNTRITKREPEPIKEPAPWAHADEEDSAELRADNDDLIKKMRRIIANEEFRKNGLRNMKRDPEALWKFETPKYYKRDEDFIKSGDIQKTRPHSKREPKPLMAERERELRLPEHRRIIVRPAGVWNARKQRTERQRATQDLIRQNARIDEMRAF